MGSASPVVAQLQGSSHYESIASALVQKLSDTTARRYVATSLSLLLTLQELGVALASVNPELPSWPRFSWLARSSSDAVRSRSCVGIVIGSSGLRSFGVAIQDPTMPYDGIYVCRAWAADRRKRQAW